MNDVETWKVIEGFSDYQISSYGNVYSIRRGRCLKTWNNMSGYPCINLRKDNKPIWQRVHRLVAENFIEKVEGKNLVNHKDGNKENNYYLNLEWTTNQENLQHASRMGLLKRDKFQGGRRYTKVSDKQVETMRKLYFGKKPSTYDLAILCGISFKQVGAILTNKSRKVWN